jgi:broad specificity phosphatase PhoE
LRTSRHTKVNEDDDSDEINLQEWDGDNNDKIEKEEDKYD